MKTTLPAATVAIAPLEANHYSQVRAIFEQGLATRNASFETRSPEWEHWDATHLSAGRLVALVGQEVAGWAALTPVSGRCVYQGVAEVSIYVSDRFRGQGLGRQLLSHLISLSESQGFWTLQAGIFPENGASLALHQAAGFRFIGKREKIGQRDGVWRDVLLLERRSQTVGL